MSTAGCGVNSSDGLLDLADPVEVPPDLPWHVSIAGAEPMILVRLYSWAGDGCHRGVTIRMWVAIFDGPALVRIEVMVVDDLGDLPTAGCADEGWCCSETRFACE